MLTIADAVTITDAMPAVSAVGSLGFAIWFAWYTTTTAIPRQQQEHRQQIKELSDTHARTISELVAELRAGRESFDRWKQLRLAELRELGDRGEK
jgi:hypothetical protein